MSAQDLAEMIAAQGQRLGLDVIEHGAGNGAPDFVYVSINDGKRFADSAPAPLYCSMSQERGRAVLLKWIDLPNGARDDAMRVLRGDP